MKIRDFCEVFDGPHATPTKTDEGPFYLSISSLNRGTLDLSKSAHLSEQEFQKWTKRVTPKKGDLLFSYETRLGEAALMPDGIKACLGRRMGILRPDTKKVLPEYLLYSYIAPEFQNVISSNTITGATVDRLSLTDFPNFEMRIPKIDQQQHIVAILSALDAKIALNQRINHELEGMAKLLYDYWFVQYDFPLSAAQAAALGKPRLAGQPYRTSGGKMLFNPTLKREIPEGWEVVTLSQITKTGSGGTPASKNREYYDGGDITWINSGELNSPYILSGTNFITQAGLDNSSAKLFPSRTLLIALYGATAGKTSILLTEACLNQAVCGIIPNDSKFLFYLKFLLSDLYSHLVMMSTGSARDNLSQDLVRNIKVVIPPPEILKQFDEFVGAGIATIANNIQQNQELITLRDWLLPMLMNGQVRVGCPESRGIPQNGGQSK